MMTSRIHVPSPTGAPIVGHLPAFAKDPLGYLSTIVKEHGDVVKLNFAGKPAYVFNDCDYIKEVFVHQSGSFHKGTALQNTKVVLGEGLLTSEGDHHRRHRRMLQPSFHRQAVSKYAQIMTEYAQALDYTWTALGTRDISEDMMKVTLEIISASMFGASMSDEIIRDIGHAVDVSLKKVMKKTLSIIPIPQFVPTPLHRQFDKAKLKLDEVIYNVIENRRKEGAESHSDLLSMLLLAQDEDDASRMTDQEVRDEVMTIFLAGHETTANTLTWTWYLLSQNPRVEEKLWEELDLVLGGRAPEFPDVASLPYLNKVIRESMRLFPAAWTVSYVAAEDVQVKDVHLKKGDLVFMSQYVMHRTEKYYERPNEFIPERFEGDFLKTIPQFAYFPFGGGPRICIGNQFALMEAAILLAVWAQKYKLRMAQDAPPVVPEPLITLRPKHGMWMTIEAR